MKRGMRPDSVLRKSLVHGIANCTQCDWQCQDYLTVQARAARHAKETGHRVDAELGYAVTYSRTNQQPKEPKCQLPKRQVETSSPLPPGHI